MAYFNNRDEYAVVNGTTDGDTIYNSTGADHATVYGGEGNDYINSGSSKSLFDGGDGDDIIANESDGEQVTLLGGAGNDTIHSSGIKASIDAGDGDDYVKNYDTAVNSTVDSGKGNDYINNWSSKSVLNGSDGDDVVTNNADGEQVTLLGGAGNDTIHSSGVNALIDAGDGDDYIRNYNTSDNATIKVGAGNDTIDQRNSMLIVHPGAGSTVVKYYIDNEINIVLDGGGGNLTFESHNSSTATVAYRFIGVDDTISNYEGDNVIDFGNALVDGISADGEDIIFRIGSARITVKNMRGKAITFSDVLGTATNIYAPNNQTPLETIKRFVHSLSDTDESDSTRALDEAVRVCSNFNGIQDAIDHFIADCRDINDAYRFLVEKCGILLDNADTGAITGWDAGGLTVKTDKNIIDETSEANYPAETSFTRNGFTFYVPTQNSIDDEEQLIVRGLYSWWLEGALDLIEESYGLNFNEGARFNFADLNMYHDSSESKTGNFSSGWSSSDGERDYWAKLNLNMANISLDSDDPTGGGLDRTIAHEMTHAMHQSYFNAFEPRFLHEGLADLTCGVDRKRRSSIIELADDADSLAAAIRLDNVKPSSGDLYSTGYMFLRYLAKAGSDSSGSTSNNLFDDGSNGQANEKIYHIDHWLKYGNQLSYNRDVKHYIGIGDAALSVDDGENVAVWLNGWDGKTYDNVKNLDGSNARSEAILAGNDRDNEIRGGSGTNLMWGGDGGDDTLYGGAGGTTYFYLYNNGADVIENARDDDVINLLNIGLEEINFADIHMDNDSIKIGMNDGGSIKVNGTADVIFQLNNGVGFRAERATGGWRLR